MADPTIGFNFLSLRIRVAEFLGIAYYGGTGVSAAQLPLDTHDLDLVGRLVNDGYRRFLTDHDRWHFMDTLLTIQFATQYTGTATSGTTTTLVDSAIAGTYADDFFNGFGLRVTRTDGSISTHTVADFTGATGTFTVEATTAFVDGDEYETSDETTVEGQNYRYFLPDDFGGVLLTPFTYTETGPRLRMDPIDEGRIREYRTGALSTGTPSVFATAPLNPTNATTAQRWELLVWPAPNSNERVQARYKRFPAAFADITGEATSNGTTTTIIDTGLIGSTQILAGQTMRIGSLDTVLTITTFNSGSGTITFTPAVAAGQTDDGADYRVFNEQRGVGGFQHDDTLLKAVLAEADREVNDTIGVREQAYQVALARSIKLDGRSQSVRRRGYGDRSEDGLRGAGFPFDSDTVDTYNSASAGTVDL